MKLRIGETWLGEYEINSEREQFVVEGLESIEEPLAVGEIVVPRDGESVVQGRMVMPYTGNKYTVEMTLLELTEGYERAGSVE